VKKAQDKKSPIPSSELKTNRKRLFKDEIPVPMSTPKEILGPG
jgi:hypothetical protein